MTIITETTPDGVPVRRLPWPVLAVCCLLPAIETAVAVYWQVWPTVTYPLLKAVQIAVPLLVWRWQRLDRPAVADHVGWKRPSLPIGIGLGLAMAGVMLLGYRFALGAALDPGPVLAKARLLGVAEHYAWMALWISLGNSAFEEYYWRGYLVGEFRRRLSPTAVVLLGGGLFGLHHVFALLPLFPLPWVVFFTFGTIVAGAAWTFLRVRGRSIIDCWLSHLIADLAIMWMGYDLIQRAM